MNVSIHKKSLVDAERKLKSGLRVLGYNANCSKPDLEVQSVLTKLQSSWSVCTNLTPEFSSNASSRRKVYYGVGSVSENIILTIGITSWPSLGFLEREASQGANLGLQRQVDSWCVTLAKSPVRIWASASLLEEGRYLLRIKIVRCSDAVSISAL